MQRIVSLILVAALAAACSNGDGKLEEAPLPKQGVKVSADAMVGTKAWPLTIDRGTVYCVRSTGPGEGAAIFVTEDGDRYALNANAEKLERYQSIWEIWIESERNPGVMISLAPLIGPALRLCK